MKEERDQWDSITYPSLTDAENDVIRTARRKGFADFYPAYPTAESQDLQTLASARAFMGSPDFLTTAQIADQQDFH